MKEQKIIAIPKVAGAGMTTTAVKGDLELDYEEDEEPTQALIAACSLSTGTTRPLVNLNRATNSTISVCGVIG